LVAAAAILVDDGIAVAHEIGGDLGARAGLGDGSGALGAARPGFVVRGALEQDREWPVAGRTVDIGCQRNAVARGDDKIVLDDDLVCCGHIHAISSLISGGPSLACRPHFRYILVPIPTVVAGA
jgi:hypothetical protein